MKVPKEFTCNVQLVQEPAHEGTLNFGWDATISAMMMHVGDAVQLTSKSEVQDKGAALLGTLLLASDVTGPCDGAPTVAEALQVLQTTSRFRLAEEHEGVLKRTCENFETRVAAEFESYIHGALLLRLHTFVSISRWVQEPIIEKAVVSQGGAVQVEILG